MAYSDEEAVDIFLDYMRYFTIKHHVPGRIRVKASLLKAKELKKLDGKGAEVFIDRIPGIKGYRLNKAALSAVIEYDADVLPSALWEEVITVNSFPAKRDELRERLLALLI